MELSDALKNLLKLKNKIEWNYKISEVEETKEFAEAIDCVLEELKEWFEEEREDTELEIKINNYLVDKEYITREEVEEIIKEWFVKD